MGDITKKSRKRGTAKRNDVWRNEWVDGWLNHQSHISTPTPINSPEKVGLILSLHKDGQYFYTSPGLNRTKDQVTGELMAMKYDHLVHMQEKLEKAKRHPFSSSHMSKRDKKEKERIVEEIVKMLTTVGKVEVASDNSSCLVSGSDTDDSESDKSDSESDESDKSDSESDLSESDSDESESDESD